ncbi:MAG: tyrosine recombinase [Clostridia bacterium]|nr:tyrosine recombinase [Clostridia bacterium]
MKDYISEYSEFLATTKGASKNTLESYTRDIKQYLSYLSNVNVDVITADDTVVSKYVAELKRLGRTPSTITRFLASVRSFYQYLMATNQVTENPTVKVKVEKTAKKLPEILTEKEIDALLSQPSISDFKGCRDKAMLELLYATGVRVTELIDLNVDDVNLQINIIHCKSSKNERIIPVYHDAIKAVSEYLSRVRPAITVDRNQKALFLNMNGERLTRQGFWKIIKSYAFEAGIKREITPHTIRHSFAAHLLENGAGLKDIKDMLGHSDISSTHIYSTLMKQRYASAYKKFHPRAGR